ncbi:phenylalanine--tRNA ligase subunit alpha [Candidatus Saccharibacteria bacterium]|nr:phenylalanine--tRNA ligase subunit alpha [Candidatus Saccharibacteria bacterium]
MSIKLTDLKSTLFAQLEALEQPRDVLKSPQLKEAYAAIPTLSPGERSTFGRDLNGLKKELMLAIESRETLMQQADLPPIDVTAPWDVNKSPASLLPVNSGSLHPLMKEKARISDIFARMGFVVEESREIDDQLHMFETLNFPKGHPARDDYDTFMTTQVDANGEALIAPAHTSTMQHRMLKKYKSNLETKNGSIAVVVPDRVFRNEDLDARHEHTFYQVEGIFVAKGVHAGMLIATLKEFLQTYYAQELDVRVNPFYFPFTEPSFEFALSCPFCEKKGCSVCSQEGWIELLGCGMIHPNVLKSAGIDPAEYTGFAFGCGIDRLVMMKYQIEDIRHFHGGKLNFLRQF